jgi:hypothetical protein
MLAGALEAVRLGFRIVPLRPWSKRLEAGSGRTGPLALATSDPAELARLVGEDPRRNIGAVHPPGVVCLDVERKNGKDGARTLRRLGVTLPPTLDATTPSGGWHSYYRLPAGARRVPRLVDASGSLELLDTWSVIPPSVTSEGAYRWLDTPWDGSRLADLPTLPKAIIDAAWECERRRHALDLASLGDRRRAPLLVSHDELLRRLADLTGFMPYQTSTLADGSRRYLTSCVAHRPDRRPSLGVTLFASSGWCPHCFAGCSIAAVLDALGPDVGGLARPR